MFSYHKSKNKGFALLELLLALGIIGIITVFALSIAYSSKNLTRTNDTKKKMRQIAKAAGNYYKGHRDLPAPAGTGSDEVPISTSKLNLEQGFRLDGWGRYFHYDMALDAVLTSRTDISGLTVNGKDVGGVIVSGGPDQTLESSNLSSPYTTAGDDIVLGINASEQALEIVLNDLQVLQSKVQAFDKIFAGVDNDSDSITDENGCENMTPVTSCPPGGLFSNDPNCGAATLNIITSYGCFPAPTSAAAFVVGLYSLADSHRIDPWLNEYVWGNSSLGAGDARYHKFFSAGPDGNPGNGDDIIP